MPPLFVLTGPSGAGKSTVLARLVADPPVPFQRFVTTTTRQPRLGETNGRDYWFVTRETFERELATDNFFEWAEVYGNYYGSNKNEMYRLQALDQPIVVILDVQGARAIKRLRPDACAIYIDAPKAELVERMSGRKVSEAEIARRTEQLATEESFRAEADVVVLNKNGELEQTIERVRNEIKTRTKGA